MTAPDLHSCFSLLFCLWTLRINSANGLEIKSTEGQSSLTVTNVTEEHYGNYTCVAANNLGMTNASLVLFSKYAEEGAHLGEPSQSFSRGKFENHSLTIKYKHMQKSEYHLWNKTTSSQSLS